MTTYQGSIALTEIDRFCRGAGSTGCARACAGNAACHVDQFDVRYVIGVIMRRYDCGAALDQDVRCRNPGFQA